MSADLQHQVLRSRADLTAALGDTGDRRAYERAISAAHAPSDAWTLPGYCQACDAGRHFALDWHYSDGETVNFRERLVCPGCGLNNRQRFVAHLVRTAPLSGPIYLYEQITEFHAWAVASLPEVTGSEYLGHDIPGGAEMDGVRHEDALRLSFDAGAFGLLVSNDVFEHVPEIDAALAESARVLRPGGRLVFSIPFFADREHTTRRAELRGGEVVQLLPPEYHGNPVTPEGSLVFYEHGWDILERCRSAGFRDAYAVGYWSALYGYLGDGLQMVFVAER